MKLTTDRLFLTEITKADIPFIHEMNSFEEVAHFNTIGIPKDLEVTAKMLQDLIEDPYKEVRTQYGWAIRLKETNTFIGEFGMNLAAPRKRRAEVHYSLLPTFWGNGYATEAAKAVLRFGFNELELHRIEAGCAVDNINSIKVLERIGMQREGRHREILPIRGEWQDNYSYAILAHDPID